MKWVLTLDGMERYDRSLVGGKAHAVAALQRAGFRVPHSICVVASAYNAFVDATGLRERIQLELHRKDFKDMRWEEIWDASLRIRNLFLTRSLPHDMETSLREAVESHFESKATVVRSSSIQEDSSRASFAGLHESFVNVRGCDAILEHVKLVWASLWSDASLLYRQELGLAVERSAMAVLIQELVQGDRSGIAFSRNPTEPSQLVLEAVYGLNQGLVDGRVDPDRWLVDRSSLRVVSHHGVSRQHCVAASGQGVALRPLPPELASIPPLSPSEVKSLAELVLSVESAFGAPQDVEWTLADGEIVVLQARPITSLPGEPGGDQRAWYLSLRRSFDNLQALRSRIEDELIPAMIREHEALAAVPLAELTDQELAREVERRREVESRWVKVYWDEFIPFAHGMRLFGQFYNDAVRPADPYEFLKLLGNSNLESVQRNRMLSEMAAMVRGDVGLRELLEGGRYLEAPDRFVERLRDFVRRFGDLSCPVTGVVQCSQGPEGLIRIILELASRPDVGRERDDRDASELERAFLAHFDHEGAKRAAELLDLGRASYRLRDDDNIHLARIEAQKIAALLEVSRRLEEKGELEVDPSVLERILKSLGEIPGKGQRAVEKEPGDDSPGKLRPRQLVGQPAGPGLARGPARVVEQPSDLLEFRQGEVLVCDAVDPNMTFVIPMASGIVERRGGMLIHGAIIAREYGLPCVTGVPDVTRWVRTGDLLTVDGFLGIVSVGSGSLLEQE